MKYILLLLSLFICGCSKKIEERETKDITINTSVVSVYDDIKLYDLINYNDIEIVSDNYKIDTDTLGSKEYEILYKENNKEYSYKFNVEVKDLTPPKIFSGTTKSVEVNSDIDPCNLISFGDNYDKKPKCIINGEYDLTKVGSYEVEYVITDSSDNKIESNGKINVIIPSNEKKSSTSQAKIKFADAYQKYKKDDTELGIDVSKWQGDINFEKVKNAGATFVMMRIGVQTKKDGELYVDSYYEQNIKKAKEAGLKVGVYLYSMATSKNEAIEHAKWVVDKLDGTTLELPIIFDWENWSKWNSYELSFHDINEIKDSYIKEVEKSGYKGMLYSSKFYLENIWETNNEPVWLAHYTENTSYVGKYLMWQMCNTGRIDGIYGDVDIDILYNIGG